MEKAPPPGPGRRGRIAVVLASLAFAAAWGLAPGIHRTFRADSAIFALASVHIWTPFFWAQDRLGMLLPLLAMPIVDPLANYLVQAILAALATILALGALAREAGARRHHEAGLVGALLLVLVLPHWAHHILLGQVHVYATSLALGLAGARALEGARGWGWLRGGCAVVVGVWVNTALAPLLLARAAARVVGARARGRPVGARGVARPVLAATAGVGVVEALIRVQGLARSPTSPLSPPALWTYAWGQLGENLWVEFLAPGREALAALGLVGVALLAARPAARRVAWARTRDAAPWLATVGAYTLAIALTPHVYRNHYVGRYAVPALLTAAAWAGAVLVGWIRHERRRTPGGAAARVALLATAGILALGTRFGAPSPAGCWRAMRSTYGPAADLVARERCTHVVGDVWNTWPTVFLATAIHAREGRPMPVFGVSNRAGPTLRAWLGMPEERLVVGSVRPFLDLVADRSHDYLIYPLGAYPAAASEVARVYRFDPLYPRLHAYLRVRGRAPPGVEELGDPLVTVEPGRDPPGELVAGPGWPLRPGDYELEVRIRFRGGDPARPAATLRLRDGGGWKEVALAPTEAGESRLQFTVPFATGGAVETGATFDLRLVWPGQVGMTLDRVRLRKVRSRR